METKGADHVTEDHIESAIKQLSDGDRVAAFNPKEQKSIIRRIDLRLAVTLGCLYCISLLDRTNLGAASVAGYAWRLLALRLLTFVQNADKSQHEQGEQCLHHCFSDVLHLIHDLPGSCCCLYPQARTTQLSGSYCPRLGSRHDRFRLRAELGSHVRSSSDTRCPGSRVLSWLR